MASWVTASVPARRPLGRSAPSGVPRRPGNDGKVRITVDFAEIWYELLFARPQDGHRTEINGLNARVERLRRRARPA